MVPRDERGDDTRGGGGDKCGSGGDSGHGGNGVLPSKI